MMDCLCAECTPCITDCVLAELEKLGQKYRVALKVAKVRSTPSFVMTACKHHTQRTHILSHLKAGGCVMHCTWLTCDWHSGSCLACTVFSAGTRQVAIKENACASLCNAGQQG